MSARKESRVRDNVKMSIVILEGRLLMNATSWKIQVPLYDPGALLYKAAETEVLKASQLYNNHGFAIDQARIQES